MIHSFVYLFVCERACARACVCVLRACVCMCVCVWVGGCVGGGGEGLGRLAVYFRQVTSSHILPLSSSFAVLQLDNLKVRMFCMAVL